MPKTSPAESAKIAPTCLSDGLRLTLGTGVAYGSQESYTIFVGNSAASTCSVTAISSVEIVDADGHPIGTPAQPKTELAQSFVLNPGEHVKADLLYTKAGNYGQDCGQVPGKGLLVKFLNQPEGVLIMKEFSGCRNEILNLLSVGELEKA